MRLNFFAAMMAGVLVGSAQAVRLEDDADLAMLSQIESEAYLEKTVTKDLTKLGKKVAKDTKAKAKAADAKAQGGKANQKQTAHDAKKKASKTDKVQDKANKQIDEILNRKPIDDKEKKEDDKKDKKEKKEEKKKETKKEPEKPTTTKSLHGNKAILKEGTPAKTKMPSKPPKPGQEKPPKKIPAEPKHVIKYIRPPMTPHEKQMHEAHKQKIDFIQQEIGIIKKQLDRNAKKVESEMHKLRHEHQKQVHEMQKKGAQPYEMLPNALKPHQIEAWKRHYADQKKVQDCCFRLQAPEVPPPKPAAKIATSTETAQPTTTAQTTSTASVPVPAAAPAPAAATAQPTATVPTNMDLTA